MALRTGPCADAFKEWAGVCDALAEGAQTIVLRKGGVREDQGPGAFVPEHDQFWLYPTAVHQAEQGLRKTVPGPSRAPEAPPGAVSIRALARVEVVGFLRDEAALPAIEDFHVLTEATVRKRFHYRRPGLWVLGARIWRRDPAFAIIATPEHAGCKTWVVLEAALSTDGLAPALDDDTWAERLRRLKSILGEGPSPPPPT